MNKYTSLAMSTVLAFALALASPTLSVAATGAQLDESVSRADGFNLVDTPPSTDPSREATGEQSAGSSVDLTEGVKDEDVQKPSADNSAGEMSNPLPADDELFDGSTNNNGQRLPPADEPHQDATGATPDNGTPSKESAPSESAVASQRRLGLNVFLNDGNGVQVDNARIGSSLLIVPEGCPAGAEFNYVWNYQGKWVDWSSTVKRSGANTTESTFVFTPTKSGRYELYVDVLIDGKKSTLTSEINIVEDWNYDALSASATQIHVGQSVDVRPVVSGADAGAAQFNYVWNYKGAWQHWGSTVKGTGSYTSEASWTFKPDRAGSYDLYVDAVRTDGVKVTKHVRVSVLENWAFDGVSVSENTLVLGQSVDVRPVVSGADAGAARFNYVWNYKGAWQHWGSTVKGTGSYTSEASWTFKPDRAGSYDLYVDAVRTDGVKVTRSYKITVASDWNAEALNIESNGSSVGSTVALGSKLDFHFALAKGSNLTGLKFNFGWRYGNSWNEWDSLAKNGRHSSENRHSLVPKKSGTYYFFADVIGTDGRKQTIQRKVDVTLPYTIKGIELSSDVVASGQPLTITPKLEGNSASAKFNYVWSLGNWAEWSSTVKETGGHTANSSWTFVPKKAGVYTLYVDIVGPDGTKTTLSARLSVNKGWRLDSYRADKPSPQSAGSTVTFTPSVSGQNSARLMFNYVWQRNNWAEWSSTIKETNSYTSSRSFTFSPKRSGKYTLYIDVYDPATGSSETFETTFVFSKGWSLKGLSVDRANPLRPNSTVTLRPNVSGNVSGLRYNYVWQVDNWSAWNSNLNQGGGYTSEARSQLKLTRSGVYTFYVDVIDQNGEKETAQVSNISCMYAGDIINRIEHSLASESPHSGGWKYENLLTSLGGTLCNNRHGWWCANYLWWGFWTNGFGDLWGTNHLQVDPEWLANDFRSIGRYTSGTRGLMRGDILFFMWNPWRPNQGISHAAYVVGVNGSHVTVIEGNMGYNSVYCTYPLWSTNIRGYARPKY